MGQAIGFLLILLFALFAEGIMDAFGMLTFFGVAAVVFVVSAICIHWDR
jgi:predicted membrane metal-binding protein